MSERFPKDPSVSGNFGDRFDSSDVVELLDRMRRNYEFMEGSVDQEDASFQDRVEVPDGTNLAVTITPTSNEKMFLFDSVSVDPADPNLDFNISNGSESTDAAILASEIPKRIHDRVKVDITNNSGSLKTEDIDLRAREISKFEGGN